MDVDGSGQVGFREFATAVIAAPTGDGSGSGRSSSSSAEALSITAAARERLFQFFDDDSSGAIDEAEMLAKMGELGFDQQGVGDLFREMGGLGGDGRRRDQVTRKQFMRYLERYDGEATA